MRPIGICGVARAGKDTFYLALKDLAPDRNWYRMAFADALKGECEEFLLKNTGISPFTDLDDEKKLIRPFLVAYGTHLRRKINPNCWIEIIQNQIKRINGNKTPVVTDVRYLNELKWIKGEGGKVIHISRAGIPPANAEEQNNDPLLAEHADIHISWPTFEGNHLEQCRKIVKKTIKKLLI